MNILILSSAVSSKNASIVLVDLMKSLKQIENAEVKMIVRTWDSKNDPNVVTIESSFEVKLKSIHSKIKGKFVKFGWLKEEISTTNLDFNIRNYDHTIDYYSTDKILKKLKFRPNFVIVLAMQFAFNFKNIYEIHKQTNAPILLYMMDMAPMTGGCHFAWDCKGYIARCGNCPAYKSDIENDISRKNWLFKNEYISKTNIIPIATTEWQYKQLLNSSLYSNSPKFKILFSIDKDEFRPSNKHDARNFLKLPIKKKIIFFGASSINSRRKGVRQLLKALQILRTKISEIEFNNIHLVIAGREIPELNIRQPFPFTMIGRLSHMELNIAFNAADVFVSPSIEDTGPMMINQSMMSGTPVVAFEMGGALDFVINGKTGYLAKLRDEDDMANGIYSILFQEQNDYNNMKENCRRRAIKLSSHEVVSKQFSALFNEFAK
jgi:glycosyltransferase involved in cell wall biosynthesis